VIAITSAECAKRSIFLQSMTLLIAATDELTVAAGLICVEFDMYPWLTTSELWTSAWRQLRKKQTKVDRREGGCKNYIFVDILYGWPLTKSSCC